jgi:hypothetical protein
VFWSQSVDNLSGIAGAGTDWLINDTHSLSECEAEYVADSVSGLSARHKSPPQSPWQRALRQLDLGS